MNRVIELVCQLFRKWQTSNSLSGSNEQQQNQFPPSFLEILDPLLSEKDMITMFTELQKSKTIKLVIINHKPLSTDATILLGQTLQVNHMIKTLVISSCGIGKNVSCILTESLTCLSIKENNIGPEGAIAVCDFLQYNKVMTSLDISTNPIGEKGALALAQMLQTNTTLVALYCNNTQIGTHGAKYFAQHLGSFSLQFLFIELNNIEKDGLTALLDSIRYNTKLCALGIQHNPPLDIQDIISIYDTNFTIQYIWGDYYYFSGLSEKLQNLVTVIIEID